QLWRKLEYIKNRNPVLASYVDVLKVVKSYLRTDLLDRIHTAQEVLDSLLYCQKMAEKNGLAQAYNFMLQTISEEYIQKKLSESHLKGDEIRVLKSWPQSLKGNVSMAKKMDSRLQVDAVVDKVQSVVRKGKMPDILNVLKDIKGDERRLLAGCDASETILTTILKLLADYADVKGKQKEKETVFDQMNAELLKLFPEQRDKILFNVMAAPLGGIPGMSSLYSKVGRSRDMEDIRPDMKKAIEDFFRMYEMGRADRKALKQEEAFLRKINVYPDRLMR
ncbi:MAG: hypothetical protein SOX32_03470, partial [Candidatus Choladocola sp.]|nr:hypothetical protein [Candidatus Choladocola sp.]